MSLKIYKEAFQMGAAIHPKSTFYVKKSCENMLIERVYTLVNQRHMTNLKNDLVIDISDGCGLIICINGQITEYCDTPGTYIYTNEESSGFIIMDASFKKKKVEFFEQYHKDISEIKFKAKDVRAYVFNTSILHSSIFSVNQPVCFMDSVYGILLMRYYGRFAARMGNPLKSLAIVLFNNSESYSLTQFYDEIQDEWKSTLNCVLSELSFEQKCSFIQVQEIQGRLTEKMQEKSNHMINKGIDVLSVQMISMLPTVESREVILQKDTE